MQQYSQRDYGNRDSSFISDMLRVVGSLEQQNSATNGMSHSIRLPFTAVPQYCSLASAIPMQLMLLPV